MRKFISALIIGTLLVLGCNGAYAQGTGRPLSEVLDPSGRIIPGINSGSYDARGYLMQLAPDGSPIFKSSPLDSNWDNRFWLSNISGAVYAAAFDTAGFLYVGGTFEAINGDISLRYIAKWNGSSWSALGSGMWGGPAYPYVYAIAVSVSDVYAGGAFTTAGGVSANYIAKWNGTSWSALGSGVSSWVYAIAVSGSDVYAGGGFTTAGGDSVNCIAKWNGTSWSALGSGVSSYGAVRAIAVSGSDVYAGGDFTTAGGVSANCIAKWNGSSWSALGSGVNRDVYAIAVNGSDVYAGGDFTVAGGVSANNIAKWNGTSWSALGSGVNGGVLAIAVSGSDVYAGGYFTTAGGVSANHIAKWNGASWSALGSGVDGETYYPWVYAITVSGSDVYAGGDFTTAGGVSANRIAKWNGTSWSALWSALGSGMTGGVWALAVNGSDVYAGGDFTVAGGVIANYIAKWNGASWSALGSGMDAQSSMPLRSAAAMCMRGESSPRPAG